MHRGVRPSLPEKFRGELFSLLRARLACYPYGMDNWHGTRYSSRSFETARHPAHTAEIIFDGTNPRVDASRLKTTTYGINRSFRLYSLSQNCAILTPPFATVWAAATAAGELGRCGIQAWSAASAHRRCNVPGNRLRSSRGRTPTSG